MQQPRDESVYTYWGFKPTSESEEEIIKESSEKPDGESSKAFDEDLEDDTLQLPPNNLQDNIESNVKLNANKNFVLCYMRHHIPCKKEDWNSFVNRMKEKYPNFYTQDVLEDDVLYPKKKFLPENYDKIINTIDVLDDDILSHTEASDNWTALPLDYIRHALIENTIATSVLRKERTMWLSVNAKCTEGFTKKLDIQYRQWCIANPSYHVIYTGESNSMNKMISELISEIAHLSVLLYSGYKSAETGSKRRAEFMNCLSTILTLPNTLLKQTGLFYYSLFLKKELEKSEPKAKSPEEIRTLTYSKMQSVRNMIAAINVTSTEVKLLEIDGMPKKQALFQLSNILDSVPPRDYDMSLDYDIEEHVINNKRAPSFAQLPRLSFESQDHEEIEGHLDGEEAVGRLDDEEREEHLDAEEKDVVLNYYPFSAKDPVSKSFGKHCKINHMGEFVGLPISKTIDCITNVSYTSIILGNFDMHTKCAQPNIEDPNYMKNWLINSLINEIKKKQEYFMALIKSGDLGKYEFPSIGISIIKALNIHEESEQLEKLFKIVNPRDLRKLLGDFENPSNETKKRKIADSGETSSAQPEGHAEYTKKPAYSLSDAVHTSAEEASLKKAV